MAGETWPIVFLTVCYKGFGALAGLSAIHVLAVEVHFCEDLEVLAVGEEGRSPFAVPVFCSIRENHWLSGSMGVVNLGFRGLVCLVHAHLSLTNDIVKVVRVATISVDLPVAGKDV